ncbi:MAG: hypothetical protein U0736_25880 [Gemmataceae bacterium]
MVCRTSTAKSTSTGEPTGSDGSIDSITSCLMTRFSSHTGTTMRPDWSLVRQVQRNVPGNGRAQRSDHQRTRAAGHG